MQAAVPVEQKSRDGPAPRHRRGDSARLLPARVLLHPPPQPPRARQRCRSRATAARCSEGKCEGRRRRVVEEVAGRAGAASPTPRLGTAAPGSRAAASAPAAAARPRRRSRCRRSFLQRATSQIVASARWFQSTPQKVHVGAETRDTAGLLSDRVLLSPPPSPQHRFARRQRLRCLSLKRRAHHDDDQQSSRRARAAICERFLESLNYSPVE